MRTRTAMSRWLLLLLLVPSVGAADPVCEATSFSFDVLVDLDMAKCFSDQDRNDVKAEVMRQVPQDFTFDTPESRDVRARQVSKGLDLVAESVANALAALRPPELAAPLRAVEAKIRAASETPATAVDWEFDRNTGRLGATGINLKSYLEASCSQGTEFCKTAFDGSVALLKHAYAMAALARHADPVSWARFQQHYADVNQRWRGYLFDARMQFPWELALNSYLFDRVRDKSESFPSPPDHQWILLHPGVALEYVNEAPAGSHFEPAVVMEWVGYNRWRWSGPDMRRPLGISLVSAYADRAGTKATGHGVLIHYRHTYSFGLTFRDGDAGVFLSFDLGRYLIDKKTQIDDAKERFKLKGAALRSAVDR